MILCGFLKLYKDLMDFQHVLCCFIKVDWSLMDSYFSIIYVSRNVRFRWFFKCNYAFRWIGDEFATWFRHGLCGLRKGRAGFNEPCALVCTR